VATVGAAVTATTRNPATTVASGVAGGSVKAARSRANFCGGMNLRTSNAGAELSGVGATEVVSRDGSRMGESVGERRLRLAVREEVVARRSERVNAAGGETEGEELRVFDLVVAEEVGMEGVGKPLRPGKRLVPGLRLVLFPRASREVGSLAGVIGGEREEQPVAALDARRDGGYAKLFLGAVGEGNPVKPVVELVAADAVVLVVAATGGLGSRSGAAGDRRDRRADRKGGTDGRGGMSVPVFDGRVVRSRAGRVHSKPSESGGEVPRQRLDDLGIGTSGSRCGRGPHPLVRRRHICGGEGRVGAAEALELSRCPLLVFLLRPAA